MSQFSNPNLGNLIISKNKLGQIDLKLLLKELGKREITSLLVEGGESIHQSFIAENLVNQYLIYIAPVVIGNLQEKRRVENLLLHKIGDDFHLIANNKEM